MAIRTAKNTKLRSVAAAVAVLSLATVLSAWSVDNAHACRPDMDVWHPHCGAP